MTKDNENAKIPVVGKFEKVSFAQYKKSLEDLDIDMDEAEMFSAWDAIKLPERATAGSAGYDFYCPIQTAVNGYTEESVMIPTGIRVKMEPGWVLMMYIRSSLGFKYRISIDNGTPIIDSDYYYADNEGHIMIKLHADLNPDTIRRNILINQGERFVQGIFVPFGVTYDDNATAARKGGMGSTGKN